eukprot:GILJ01008609.1.p1 GENE.GILJ01008609.1~~GILJ01008609.1.p1  ORF type:complete len:304 (-),score=52.68 GILJ01008609.1:575-1486(-)
MFGRKTKKSGSRRFLVSDSSGSKPQSQSSKSGKNSLEEPWEDVMDSEDALFKSKGDELVQLRAKIYHLQEENTTLRENLKEMELHITTMNVEALNSENEALKAKVRTLEEKQKWFDGLTMPSAVQVGDEDKSVDSDSTDESVHNRRASDCPSPAVPEPSSLPQSPFRSLSYQTSIGDSSKVEAAYLVSADENASADELRREIHQLGQELAKAKISWALAESEHIHVKAKYKKLERVNSQYLLRIEDMENELKEWRMRLSEANRRVLEVEGDREGLTEQIKRADLQLLDMRSQLTFALRWRLEH